MKQTFATAVFLAIAVATIFGDRIAVALNPATVPEHISPDGRLKLRIDAEAARRIRNGAEYFSLQTTVERLSADGRIISAHRCHLDRVQRIALAHAERVIFDAKNRWVALERGPKQHRFPKQIVFARQCR